jgi:peptidoglycan hydrolase-like protein with peptidoglycan-binding domain
MTKSADPDVLALQRAFNHSGFAYRILGEPLVEDGIYGPATDQVHRAYLDEDKTIPTVTPQPAKPWWTHRALLGGLATVLASVAAIFGLEVDSGQLSEVLVAAITAITGALSIWGALREKGGIDPTLVVGTVRLPVRPQRQDPPGDDPRGVFRDY